MKFGAPQIEPRQVRALEIAVFDSQRTTGRGEQSLHVFTCESGIGDGMNARVRRRRIERHEKLFPFDRRVPDPKTVVIH